ncbi:MAG: thioredoxin [Alistipes sp.]|jgi:thioredoxin 1|nr:thioredoxin [Alistipes sp.]
MAMEITSANFTELLESGAPLVVDFWAEWCGPCRMIGPMVEELAAEYDGRITVGKCNVDKERDLPTKYSIRNIPTLLFFKDGELADRHVGALNRADLKAKMEALLG